jgi:hypothetical protein
MGTAIIIFFAVLCVGLSALVLSFVFSGKKKDEDEVTSSEKDKI